MDKRLAKLLIFLLFSLLPMNSPAADEGPYLSVSCGGSYLPEIENNNSSGSFNLDLEYGYATSLAFGYDLGTKHPDLGTGRVEMEIGYRTHELKEAAFLEGDIAAAGDLDLLSIMLSTYAEPEDRKVDWTPYVGFGIGAARITLDRTSISGDPLVDDSDWVFAGHFGLGSGYKISDHLTLDLGYRFFTTTTPEFKDATGAKFESEYQNHLVQGTIRVTF